MTALITKGIWKRLTSAAKNSHRPASVAVAYFGKGASKLLPLAAGSRLVVDASEFAVKKGQTCPAELKQLVNKGVKVYSVPNLHAKVFVFGGTAFIGSTNASNHSAKTLVEAVATTTDPKTVKVTREFVANLCTSPDLGPAALDRLQKLYKEPHIPGAHGHKPKKASGGVAPVLPRIKILQLTNEYPPEESEDTQAAGTNAANKKQKEDPKRFMIDYFWWPGPCAYKEGDLLLMVTDEGQGKVLVSPPGRVVHKVAWSNGTKKYTFTYLELRKRPRISFTNLAKKLDSSWKKRLRRDGFLSADLTAQLLKVWN